MATATIVGKPPSTLQFSGYILRLAGPGVAIVAAAVKLLIAHRDAVSICVFIGLLLYGAGYVIKRYF
jgi:hypothetical protein